jgi:hypothetical protein
MKRRIRELSGPERLGRHIEHDKRSWSYQAGTAAPTSVMHRHWGPVLDQGDLGSCTGNATAQCLNCTPEASKVPGPLLDESAAVNIYSLATKLDPYPGSYPPNDTGSSGLAAMKAAVKLKLIAGYAHTFSFDQLLGALTLQPGILGINWYDSFDEPLNSGECPLTPDASIRGGHEVCLLGLNVKQQRVWCLNSWGRWGAASNGRFWFSYATLRELLAEQGDATFPRPLA